MTTDTPHPMRATSDADLLLRFYADQLGDVEALRIATENRLRSLLSDEEWGASVRDDLPEVIVMQGQLDQIRAVEHGVELALKRAMRVHPLGAFVKRTVGLGEKQTARLLASIGDPAARERPSQLWAYCGLHVLNGNQQSIDTQPVHGRSGDLSADHIRVGIYGTSVSGHHPTDRVSGANHEHTVGGVAPRRTRGQKANWNTEAKSRAYLVAVSCMKNRNSPYRDLYDYGRAKYAESTHNYPCVRCGPQGRPALAGSPLSDGHKHARALRLVAKRVLLDLWREARGGDSTERSSPKEGASPATATHLGSEHSSEVATPKVPARFAADHSTDDATQVPTTKGGSRVGAASSAVAS